MPSLVVVGMQFGDESKGAVVDYLAEWADLVVRYNGGSNAGHTVVAGGHKYKLHLVPSGSVRGKLGVIGAGVAFDPEVFLEEVQALRERGIEPNLVVSLKASLVMPYHKEIDSLIHGGKLGTTKRGVGPAYQDKMSRITGLKVMDLYDRRRVKDVLSLKAEELEFRGIVKDRDSFIQEMMSLIERWAQALEDYVGDDTLLVNEALSQGKFVVFEGAQGTMLDVDHGTYPFVTSSNPITGGVCTGVGLSPKLIDRILGVSKAYTTRVGAGPFPTELKGDLAAVIRDRGGEYGTTTGRPRRVGWLDLPMLRYSKLVNGVDYLAIRKLDVLAGLERVKVAVSYEIDGQEYRIAPPYVRELEKAEPVYEELDGWEEGDWEEVVRGGWEAQPKGALKYLEFLERELETPVLITGWGPQRELTIPSPRLKDVLREMGVITQ